MVSAEDIKNNRSSIQERLKRLRVQKLAKRAEIEKFRKAETDNRVLRRLQDRRPQSPGPKPWDEPKFREKAPENIQQLNDPRVKRRALAQHFFSLEQKKAEDQRIQAEQEAEKLKARWRVARNRTLIRNRASQ